MSNVQTSEYEIYALHSTHTKFLILQLYIEKRVMRCSTHTNYKKKKVRILQLDSKQRRNATVRLRYLCFIYTHTHKHLQMKKKETKMQKGEENTCNPRNPNRIKGWRKGKRDLLRMKAINNPHNSWIIIRQVNSISSKCFIQRNCYRLKWSFKGCFYMPFNYQNTQQYNNLNQKDWDF